MSFVCALILVGVVVAAGLWGGKRIVESQEDREPPMPVPPRWGVDPDDRRWEREAAELAHTELASAQESAKNWAASIGALLGIGTTVAFVKGEDTFAKLSTGEGNFVFALAVAAFLLAGVAIATATFAAQGAPRRFESLDGWTLSNASRDGAQRSLHLLLWSRVLAVMAAVAVFAGFATTWKAGIASEDPGSGVSAIAATDGGVRCGKLESDAAGKLALVVGETENAVQESTVEIVDSCPESGDD